jgi:hypothetical protein
MAARTRSSGSGGGGFSVFRISVIAALLGGLFLVVAFVFTQLDTASQRQPLMIDPPAGAELRLQEDTAGTSRALYYFIPNTTAEDVAVYYDQKMREFYGGDATEADVCRRVPATGEYQGYVEGAGMVPYEFKCLFYSASGFGTGVNDRETLVSIQPGVRNDATGLNNQGGVVVEYAQRWQP